MSLYLLAVLADYRLGLFYHYFYCYYRVFYLKDGGEATVAARVGVTLLFYNAIRQTRLSERISRTLGLEYEKPTTR